jgi:Uma2 family endonuclease
MTQLAQSSDIVTLGDLLERLGGIPADRVRFYPLPGTATEEDVVAIEARENHLCELVDGVLVEKPMGYRESFVAMLLATSLNNFVLRRKLGAVTGADGMIRLFPGLVRIPDVAFVSRQRLPGGRVPSEPIPHLVPDLAVEVLSLTNTEAEMARKRREYFEAGVRLVWLIDPQARSAAVFTGPEQSTTLGEDGVLEGGEVLPGFAIPLRDLLTGLD